MQVKSMLSIGLIVTMLVCGTHFAEEAHHGFCDCMQKSNVEMRQKCEHIVLNACSDGKLSVRECDIEAMFRRIKQGHGFAPETSYDKSEAQRTWAYAFIEKRISATNTYSHKILVDYIHLQDGANQIFI